MNTSNPRFTSPGSTDFGKNEGGIMETVKDKAEGMASAVSEATKDVRGKIKETAASVADTTSCAWDSTKHAAEDFGADVAQRAQTVHADSVIFIRRNPMASVLGALGAGFLLGLALTAATKSRS